MSNIPLILVSGPAKSGKSKWAEMLLNQDIDVTYLATSQTYPEDLDWVERINKHKTQRPDYWDLVETASDINRIISDNKRNSAILIDSLGGFVSYHIDSNNDKWLMIKNEFLNTLTHRKTKIVIVIEEVGWGVIPPTQIGCRFRDRAGELSQHLQSISTESWLVLQGIAIDLKKTGSLIES